MARAALALVEPGMSVLIVTARWPRSGRCCREAAVDNHQQCRRRRPAAGEAGITLMALAEPIRPSSTGSSAWSRKSSVRVRADIAFIRLAVSGQAFTWMTTWCVPSVP